MAGDGEDEMFACLTDGGSVDLLIGVLRHWRFAFFLSSFFCGCCPLSMHCGGGGGVAVVGVVVVVAVPFFSCHHRSASICRHDSFQPSSSSPFLSSIYRCSYLVTLHSSSSFDFNPVVMTHFSCRLRHRRCRCLVRRFCYHRRHFFYITFHLPPQPPIVSIICLHDSFQLSSPPLPPRAQQ